MLCSVPFDSFNTKDIDTVDDGIEGLLFDYLPGHKSSNNNNKNNTKNKHSNKNDTKNKNNNSNKNNKNKTSESSKNTTTADWGLLVAHFLGVDHIGHR